MNTDQFLERTPNISCSAGDAYIQMSSHHNSACVKLTQLLTFCHFYHFEGQLEFCIGKINFQGKLEDYCTAAETMTSLNQN